MIRRPPLRFLASVVGGWAAARAAWLVPWPAPPLPSGWRVALPDAPAPRVAPPRRRAPVVAAKDPPLRPDRRVVAPVGSAVQRFALADDGVADAARIARALLFARATGPWRWRRAPGPVPLPDPADRVGGSRWHGNAYLFARSGSGAAALAPGGQLGGSQAGARLTYRIAPGIAAAARASVALHDRQSAEAAAGIDWQPFDRAAFRLSAERRVALGTRGRVTGQQSIRNWGRDLVGCCGMGWDRIGGKLPSSGDMSGAAN